MDSSVGLLLVSIYTFQKSTSFRHVSRKIFIKSQLKCCHITEMFLNRLQGQLFKHLILQSTPFRRSKAENTGNNCNFLQVGARACNCEKSDYCPASVSLLVKTSDLVSSHRTDSFTRSPRLHRACWREFVHFTCGVSPRSNPGCPQCSCFVRF